MNTLAPSHVIKRNTVRSVLAQFRPVLSRAQKSTHHFANFDRPYLDRNALSDQLSAKREVSAAPKLFTEHPINLQRAGGPYGVFEGSLSGRKKIDTSLCKLRTLVARRQKSAFTLFYHSTHRNCRIHPLPALARYSKRTVTVSVYFSDLFCSEPKNRETSDGRISAQGR